MIKKILLLAMVAMFTVGISSCREESTGEKVGDAIEDAGDDIEDEMED
ncbi:hypothetical protein [Nonlabens ponticola]|nr:hypothetical protein [Nonlabens ponticola]